jgi:hypothetical protein
MEFLHSKNDSTRPVDSLRINWYYRPKDIGRKITDTRLVFATMHSDISPLTALRGKCQIRHRAEITNMDEFRKTPDSFWYEKLYDRYIQKNYDLIPTPQIVNVPDKVKKVLDDRWKYVLVEQGRGKELTSAVKLCKRCSSYCARYVCTRAIRFLSYSHRLHRGRRQAESKCIQPAGGARLGCLVAIPPYCLFGFPLTDDPCCVFLNGARHGFWDPMRRVRAALVAGSSLLAA